MKCIPTFSVGFVLALALSGLAIFCGSPQPVHGGADDALERKVTTLEREVEDLQKTVDDLSKRLETREKAISVSSSAIEIKAGRIDIDASFSLDLEANTIRLNNGRHEVARVGSKVDPDKGITDGARSVLVP